jgi:hypothetical protein
VPRIILKAGVVVMSPWREALAAGLLAILVGLASSCSDTGGGSNADGTPAPTTTNGSTDTPSNDPSNEPSIEPTVPEPTQPTRQKPSIKLASGPIGGNVDARDNYQCAEVNWRRNPIPDGTRITAGQPRLRPGGIFKLDQRGCPAGSRRCAGVRWTTNDSNACFVGVRQIAAGSKDVTLVVPVTATCATKADCQFLAGGRGSEIAFSPGDFGVSPPPSDSPAPSDSPPRSASSTPSDG